MVGETFRGAYDLSKQVARTPIAENLRPGRPNSTNRRIASSYFSANLSTIALLPRDKLEKVFSCHNCEEIDREGTRTTKVIVMDGATTGILGGLSGRRFASLVKAATETKKLKFCIRRRKTNRF